jgi:uncharacterized protein (TIGR03435 family)
MLLFLAAGALLAQPRDARPAFEAATVRINTSGLNGSSSNGSGSQVVMTNMTMKRLIERAYSLKPYQVTGPAWMENVHVDIAAKYPLNMKDGDRPLMLRTLLEDQFQLSVHRETKDLPGYALVVAKGGFKLKAGPAGDEEIDHYGKSPEILKAKNTTMGNLADHLARILGDTLVDRTGVEGAYDFELRWTVEDAGPGAGETDRAAAKMFAIQNALGTIGVRLQAEKVPVEVIVVDHLERAPRDN